ncbi:MAG: hypothetical protein E7Z66_05310 [Thermoplasmata archaeon]|nr:hypothetical protein [Thermoplasmata archaeon]
MANEICDVSGCNCESERSLNIKKVSQTSLQLKNPDCRQVHLCKEHYRAFKKESKNTIPDYYGNW